MAEPAEPAVITREQLAARRESLTANLAEALREIADGERDIAQMRATEQRIRGALSLIDELTAALAPPAFKLVPNEPAEQAPPAAAE